MIKHNWGKIIRITSVYLTPFTLNRKPNLSLMGMGAEFCHPWCYLAMKSWNVLQTTRASFIPPGEILVYSRHNWIKPDMSLIKNTTVLCFPCSLRWGQVTKRRKVRLRTRWAAARCEWSTSNCTPRWMTRSTWWSLTSWARTPSVTTIRFPWRRG